MSEKKNNSTRKNLVRAAYAPDGPGAEQMVAVLKQFGIDAVRQGGVKDIYKVGGDIVGEEIMVSPEDLAKAQEVLGQMTGSSTPQARPDRSVKKTILCLGAAAILLIIMLILRGALL